MSVPPDRGLQPERTALAWRRTALGVAVGSLFCLRVLPTHLGASGWVLSILGLCWSADLTVAGSRRLREARASLRRPLTGPVAGPAVARTAALTLLVALAALVTTIVIAAGAPA